MYRSWESSREAGLLCFVEWGGGGAAVVGSLALRGFLSAPHPEGGAVIIAGVEARREGYGFILNGYNKSDRQVITDVARILGYPDFQLT